MRGAGDPKRGEIWMRGGASFKILYLGKDDACGTDLVIYQNVQKQDDDVVRVCALSVFLVGIERAGIDPFVRYECDR
jgi:hypothetical protein